MILSNVCTKINCYDSNKELIKLFQKNRSFKKLFANRCDKICIVSSLENDYVNDNLFMRINIAAIL